MSPLEWVAENASAVEDREKRFPIFESEIELSENAYRFTKDLKLTQLLKMAIFNKKNGSLIAEIQTEATNSKSSLSDLLKKCLVVCRKLKLEEFGVWVNNELNGYSSPDLPEYRNIRCSLKLYNPQRGLIPCFIEDPELEQHFNTIGLSQSVGSLCSLLGTEVEGQLTAPLTGEEAGYLMKTGNTMGMPPVRQVAVSELHRVLDSIRNKILDFALGLEESGIKGDGMSFTEEEKEQADKLQNINIDNFQGILGNVSDSTVNQSNDIKVVKNDFDSLAKHLNDLGIAFSDVRELEQAVEKDGDISKKNLSGLGENVSGWIGNMVAKASTGSWNVSIAAAGNILGTAICKYYGM